MRIVVIPDMHLERFSKNERRILINKFIEKLLRENFDILIFNGDFYAGGRKNRGKVIGLLHRIERVIKRKIIHFPGSHEDFSHSYRFRYYENFITMIPGSQFIASHNQKPVYIEFEIFEDLLDKEKIDVLITHDPLPETVDCTIFFSNDFIIPSSYLVERAIRIYSRDKIVRRRVDRLSRKLSLSDEFLDLLSIVIDVINEEREILSKIFGKEFERIEFNERLAKIVFVFSCLNEVEVLKFGSAVHFSWMYGIKEKIIDVGIPIVISGHIHENMFFNDRIVRINGVSFCNPGPGYLGNYCIVDLDKKKVSVKSII